MAAKRPNRRRARNPWVRRLKRAAVFLGITFGVALSAGLAVYIPIYREAADDALNIERRLVVLDSNPTVVLSADLQANGQPKVLYSVAAIRRNVVDLKSLPSHVRFAIVAAEDRRFYDHRGVDPIGLARAAFTTVRDRHASSGGSTISMQLAKLMINGDARTPMRKLKDMATAQQIESLKTKDEILNIYANYAYYGERAFGIQRAAQIYFGKDAKDLTVGEAAMLARSVRLPSRVNPVKTPEKMIPLRDYVLGVMRDEGWITKKQYDEGIREVPKLNPHPSYNVSRVPAEAGYFVQHVLTKFEEDNPGIDYRSGGYRIYTTLNYKLQMKAVAAVKRVLRENRGHGVNNGAIVVMDQFGRILAEVGGADYRRSQFNVITQGKRQPGSAFKAFVYATALKNGVVHPGEYISNGRIRIKDGDKYWEPQNASPRENANSYSLESAFAQSVNRPAIHTIMKTGEENVVATAKDVFGFKSHLGATPSLALGSYEVKPLEMLQGYSVFMLGGNRAEPQVITRVVGPDGDVVPKFRPIIYTDVLDPRVAKEMDDILKAPVAYGTATYARVVPNARGKTGTTNDAKDAWFCGYSDGLVGVGWVGNSGPNGSARRMSSSVFGGTVTVKIWTAVMLGAHNLKLAKGVTGSPSTSVTVSTAPDEEPEVKPIRQAPEDGPTRDPVVPEPDPGPVVITPPVREPQGEPDPEPITPPADLGDKWDPTKEPPIEADKVKPEPNRRADSPKRDRPRRDPPRRDPPVREPEMVPVEICVDTGLRASMYCPETVTREFAKGRGPRRTCSLHHG